MQIAHFKMQFTNCLSYGHSLLQAVEIAFDRQYTKIKNRNRSLCVGGNIICMISVALARLHTYIKMVANFSVSFY